MKAWMQDRYGGTETLQMGEAPTPTPGTGEVLVRVRAAGIDRGTWHLLTGLPLAMRPVSGLRRPKQPVPGRALAGVVEAIGEGVTRFAVGDQVYGTASGSLAELTVAPEKRLARMPAGLSFEEAAAVPISAQTALLAVRQVGQVEAGQSVLVIGASGGVGSYAVQLAKAYGAEVTAVASSTKLDFVRSLGADHVIDYGRSDIDEAGRRYDVVLDIAGNRPVSRLRRVLAPRGTLVLVGGEDAGRWFGMRRQLGAVLRSPFTRQRLAMLVGREAGADLETLGDLVEAGRLRPTVDRAFAFDAAEKALLHLESGHTRGKVVVTVAG
jgi:NADPH:quinone reductase-like Zn-dependent oxidoreductase